MPSAFEQRRVGVGATSGLDPRLTERVWYVWVDGGKPIGPVSADQIARGIRAGKVPSDVAVRRETQDFWVEVTDVADIIAALKAVTAESQTPPPTSAAGPSPSARQYLVWIPGGDPVGPVSAQQIARGIRAGKVPTDASIQPVDDIFACDVLDEPEVIAALKNL